MLYIKGFDKDLRCRDFQFEVGKEYKIDNDKPLELCSDSVFLFCKTLEDVHIFYSCYKNDDNRFCYIEALSEVVEDGNKLGCSHIKIIREIMGDELNELLGLINGNTGLFNLGDHNSGNWNSGNRNTGDCNSGNRNTGDCNSGDENSGNWNSGYSNSGDENSGDRNSGNWNSGIFNSCDHSTGVFCEKTHTIKLFDMESNMTMEKFQNSEYYNALYSTNFELTKWDESQQETIYVDYKEACKNWWSSMTEKNKEIILSLPNFNATTFFNITGIKIYLTIKN